MKNRNLSVLFSLHIVVTGGAMYAQKITTTKPTKGTLAVSDRQFWLAEMDKMVRPVIYSLAQDSLWLVMLKVT